MKKKIGLIIFTTLFFTLQSAGTALAGLRAEPIPMTMFDTRGVYGTDLFTGTAAYAYKIPLPKGTNGLTPDVSLSYNSSGANSFSAVAGIGWDLSRDYVERDVNYTPGNTGDDKLKLHLKGGVYDLVFVSLDGRYHTKTETNLNITKLTSGAANELGEYWQVITKDGTKYRFGQASNSELMCNGRSYVYRWNLDMVTDTHSNNIYFTYTESNGASYLSQIKYNNDQSRIVDFTYTTSPYAHPVYVQGCSINENQRLSSIQTKINTSPIRQFDLTYTSSGNTGQLLQAITEKGSNGSALPSTTFDYNAEIKSWNTQGVKWIDNADIDAILSMQPVRLIDMNNDGLPDIVRTFGTNWKVLLNQGTSWSTTYITWLANASDDARLDRASQDVELVDVTGDNLPDIVMAAGADTWRVWRNTGTSFNAQSEVWANLSAYGSEMFLGGDHRTRLFDVTGDGLADVVSAGDSLWRVFRNTGNSWNGSPETWSSNGVSLGLNATNIRLLDVNGDGLADIVKTNHNGTVATWTVYKNTGTNWSSAGETWINNADIDAYFEKAESTVGDVNGDGLLDIIKGDDLGGADRWKVLLNLGDHWSTTYETWIDPSANLDLDVHDDDVRIADVNGDGLSDIVKGGRTCSTCSFDTWTVWKNNGNATRLLSAIHTSQGGTTSFEYKPSTIYDNTGSDNFSDLPFSLWVVQKKTENNGMTGVHGTNDITTYSYQDGSYDWQSKELRGFGTVDENLPDGTKKKYVFFQDDALKGMLQEVQVRDSQNNPYTETEETWSNTLSNGVYTVNLLSEKNYTYDGTATNPKIVQTDYQYDVYGNLTKKSELGDTSITGDERYTYNDYIYNPISWIVDKVSHTTLKASDDATLVSQVLKYYDTTPNTSSPSAAFGNGYNGNLTIIVNTTEAPIDSFVSATAGNNTAAVGAGLGFATNQLVLLHQTQGTNAGTWEFARVQGYSGMTLTFTTPLANSYSSSGSNHAQVRVIPEYQNVTVNPGATWSAKSWNGTTGGILAFVANGTVTINGTINASAVGYRGGVSANNNGSAFQGEGYTGIGTQSTAANSVGAGGGTGDDSHGGGGGHATAGEIGGVRSSGAGGGTGGTEDLTTMILGGGGGGSAEHYSQTGGPGGSGGGIVFISGSTITITGAIASNGGLGSVSGDGDQVVSGSGAGGSVLLRGQQITLGSSLVTTTGGISVIGSGNGARFGGAGGLGRIRVEYDTTMSGSTNPSASNVQTVISGLPAPVPGFSTIPTKGDLTEEDKWLNGGTNPQTFYEYDAYGNLTKVIDANYHPTTTAYDTATHTYPISITNAKNQTTNVSYDLGTGSLLSKTDPNNLITSYEYDLFGRVTKEIRPYDTSNLPTISYQYLVDGTAPEGTFIAKREVTGEAGTIDAYTFVDGFGRKIQIQQDAEDTSKTIVTDTFYDPNGEVAKQTVPYLASSSATVSPTPTPVGSEAKFGDGSNGNLTISSNTTEAPIDSSVTAIAGTTTATIGSGLSFATNQILLFHQTQGINAGLWEFARVQSYSGTALILTAPLIHSYNSSGNDHAQVRVVPQYGNVTVNSNVTWSAKPWNGITGGILAYLANGTVTINGTIDAKGKGFRGGAGQNGSSGIQGESQSGTGSVNTAANGISGGSGMYHSNKAGGGGGGGGHATVGGNGTDANTDSNSFGFGGGTGGTADLTTMLFGGAGGGGGTRAGNNVNNYTQGRNGGGIIFITGATVTVAGQLTTSGEDGTGGADDNNHGIGGQGAGGSVLIKAQNAALGINLLSSLASTNMAVDTGDGGNGGTGGVGRIRVEYETSFDGTTNPSANSLQTQIPVLPEVQSIPGINGGYITPDITARYTEMSYDPLERVTIVRNPKGDSKTTAYDHWKETTIDENGHIKRIFKNAYDKIAKVEEVNGINTYTTNYTYDARDLLTRITDNANNNFDFAYDTVGRKTSDVDPDMGTWIYTYDGVDNVLTKKDNRNITTTFTYDELNRKTGVNYPGDTDVTYTYDGNNKIGTLTFASDSAGLVNYTYDDRLRKTQEQRVMDGITWITTFVYDAADRLISRTNPDNTVEAFTFNNQGEIDSLTDVLSNIDYNAQGKITKKDFANGVVTNYSYNTDDFRLARIQTAPTASGSSLLDNNYTYDNVGNILSITDNLLTKTQSFGYDDLDRLTSASESAGYNYAYEYNPIGNLTKFIKNGTTIDYTYGTNAGSHAMTGSTEGEAISTPTPTPTDAPTPTPTPTPTGTPTPTSTPTPTPTPLSAPVVRASNSGSVSTGSLVLNKPTNTVNGDLLILTASADLNASENVTYTIPSGWTQLLANTRSHPNKTGVNLQVWYKIANSEPATYTITPDHNKLIGGSIIRIDGHNASTPFNGNAVTASNTGEASAPSVTTTINNDLILRIVTWDQDKTIVAIASGHTQTYYVDVTGHDNWGGYKVQSTAGSTGVAQFDLSGGSPYVGFTVAIRP